MAIVWRVEQGARAVVSHRTVSCLGKGDDVERISVDIVVVSQRRYHNRCVLISGDRIIGRRGGIINRIDRHADCGGIGTSAPITDGVGKGINAIEVVVGGVG